MGENLPRGCEGMALMRGLFGYLVVVAVFIPVQGFVDIRANTSFSNASVESAPQQQVHVVFSSHLVCCS
jgi:hypothetical protein